MVGWWVVLVYRTKVMHSRRSLWWDDGGRDVPCFVCTRTVLQLSQRRSQRVASTTPYVVTR